MTAEILPFSSVYIERIAQLTNKTNQFNTTTKRYSQAEMEALLQNPEAITLYGKLTDKFGDNGLISVVVGKRKAEELHIDLWLMSCRVLKRDMELAMLDNLVEAALKSGVTKIYAYYFPTEKNSMVENLYGDLGFTPIEKTAEKTSKWVLEISPKTQRKNKFIEVNK